MKHKFIEWCVGVSSFLIIIIGYLVNPSRKSPTISWLPQFVYVEHLVGAFALGIIFFYLFYLVAWLPSLIGCPTRDKKTNFDIARWVGGGIALVFPIYYEFIVQKRATLEQLPFDLVGVLFYWSYICHMQKIKYLRK